MSQSQDPASTDSAPQPIATLLNDSQHRSLCITLRRIELAAWHLEEQLTQHTSAPLVLTRPTNFLDSQQQEALLLLAQQVRREIAHLAQVYQLPAEEHDLARTLMAEFTLLWCDLEDVRPKKLTRYGPVAPAAHQLLDPPLQHLIRLVLTIDAVGSGKFPPEQVLDAREQLGDA